MEKKIEKSTLDITQIKIYGITFNLAVSIKRLKQDLRDDWFPDFLDYKDIFRDNSFFLDKLEKYIEKNSLYNASSALHFDIPKEGYTIRCSSETNIIDRLMYQACVDVIAPTLDKIHSVSIYSHRINTDWGNKYFFRYAVAEWNKFITDVQLELNKEENEVLLATDISHYFESISIKDLTNTLNFQMENVGLSPEQEDEFKRVATQLNSLLNTWCEPNTKRGIPQNRDASSFLSNLFLNPVDDAMLKSGYKYFRYMDDIRVVCKDKYAARKALKLLVNELRKKGLHVNSKKTLILDLNNEQQRSVANEALQKSDKKIDQIENLLNSKKPRGVQIAVPMLRDKTISLIESGGTLDRHFRFCVNRLERLSRIPELETKLDLNEITDAIISELLNQPWSTDTFSRYLISSKLSSAQLGKIMSIITDDTKNIYEWQEFHLWRVLINHQYSNAELFSKARNNLIQRATNTPIVAGSILYLCAIGDGNDRKHVADNFLNLTDFFSQRIALIGIKSLDYTSVIKTSVEKYLDPSLKGCYSQLRDNFKDLYYYKPSKLNYKNFYDELPEFIS